jgi:hypothetical protein
MAQARKTLDTTQSTASKLRPRRKESLQIPLSMEDRDNLQRLRVWAIDHNEVGKAGHSPKPNRQRGNLTAFGPQQGVAGKAGARRYDGRFHAIGRVHTVCRDVAPDIVQIAERLWAELKGKGHFSGNSPLGAALLKDADSFLAIHEFSPLGLREAFRDLRGNGFLIGQHPVIIPKLLANHGKGLIEDLFRAHAGPGGPIEHLFLSGFEFEDHRKPPIVPRKQVLAGL